MSAIEPGGEVASLEGPVAVDTAADEHGRGRWRRIAISGGTAAIARVTSILVVAVSVPFTIDVLGADGYGLVVLITQLSVFFAFSDLGIGNGVISKLSGSLAREDGEAREIVSSALFLMSCVAAVLAVIAAVLVPVVPWDSLLGFDGSDLAGSVTACIAVFCTMFLLGIPLTLSEKVLLARQQAHVFNIAQLAGAIVMGTTTAAAVVASAAPWVFVAATMAAPLVGVSVSWAWLAVRAPDLRPRSRFIRRATVVQLARSGGLFLVLGLAGAFAFETDSIVVSRMLGAEDVTSYYLALRLFGVPLMLVGFVLLPMWPAFSDALARGDDRWVVHSLRRAMLLAAAVNVPTALLLLLSGPSIVSAWAGSDGVATPIALYAAFAVWVCSNSVSAPLAMLLNGAHVVRFQVVCAISMAIANVGLTIAFTAWIGLAGPIIGSVIAQTLFATLPSLVYVHRRGWLRTGARA